MSILFQVTFDN